MAALFALLSCLILSISAQQTNSNVSDARRQFMPFQASRPVIPIFPPTYRLSIPQTSLWSTRTVLVSHEAQAAITWTGTAATPDQAGTYRIHFNTSCFSIDADHDQCAFNDQDCSFSTSFWDLQALFSSDKCQASEAQQYGCHNWVCDGFSGLIMVLCIESNQAYSLVRSMWGIPVDFRPEPVPESTFVLPGPCAKAYQDRSAGPPSSPSPPPKPDSVPPPTWYLEHPPPQFLSPEYAWEVIESGHNTHGSTASGVFLLLLLGCAVAICVSARKPLQDTWERLMLRNAYTPVFHDEGVL